MNISSVNNNNIAIQTQRMGDLLKDMTNRETAIEDKMLNVTVTENVKALTQKGINLDLLA